MVSGFLVRHDGALISIDHIIYIVLEPQIHVVPTKYRIMIYIEGDHRVQWNKDLLPQPEAGALLQELKELIKKAIEL